MSAIDLTEVGDLASAVNNLAHSMNMNKEVIASARCLALEFSEQKHVDLGWFAYFLVMRTTVPRIGSAVLNVLMALDNAVIAPWPGMTKGEKVGLPPPVPTGLAIYFPEDESDFDSDYNSTNLGFADVFYWDEFLTWYYQAETSVTRTLIAPWQHDFNPGQKVRYFVKYKNNTPLPIRFRIRQYPCLSWRWNSLRERR